MHPFDEHRKRHRSPPRSPYPLLRVSQSGEFLSALRRELESSIAWRPSEPGGEFDAVVANYGGDCFRGQELGVVAYDFDFDLPDPINVICFATGARKWVRNGTEVIFPSSAEISAAFKLYLPVVKAACKASGVRCRINYPNTTKAKPISAGVIGKLDAFVRAANTTVLHPYDWERFLRFVRYCHAHNVSLGQARLYDELTKREISSKMAKRLAQIYSHGRAVLSYRFEWIE